MGFLGNNLNEDKTGPSASSRNIGRRALLLVTLSFLFGLWLVYQAKRERLKLVQVSAKLSSQDSTENGKNIRQPGELLNLNQISKAGDLTPYLTNFEDATERAFAAEIIFKRLEKQKFKNVEELRNVRVNMDDLQEYLKDKQGKYKKVISDFETRLAQAKIEEAEKRAKEDFISRLRGWVVNERPSVSFEQFRKGDSISSSFIVRTPEGFRNALLLSSAIFLLGFGGLHLYWRFRRFRGDQLILPNIFALCSFGFLMMISLLRDPLRDTLSFSSFAWGVMFGNLFVALLTSFNYHDLYYALKERYKHTDLLTTVLPIGLSLLLCAALLSGFGKGPGASKAKINLEIPFAGFAFQPSELIKLLLCFFIAAYFSNRWELIQNLNAEKFRFLSLPRGKDVLIIFLCVALVLGLFFVQQDLGPALLMAGLFLILFAIVRRQILLSAAGFLTIIGGYVFNYYVYSFSPTAAQRFEIWKDPWKTSVRGGEHIVHSFWALANGGFAGTGLGLGDPGYAPAAHTDLILSSLGEELGFLGLLLVFTLNATLFYRCLKIALNTTSIYTFFLVAGITIINALQFLFISAAILGLIPLSGITSPFLSYGSTSMVVSFIAFGIVLVISGQTGEPLPDIRKSFATSAKYLSWAFGIVGLFILANAAWIQVWKADEIMVKSVSAPQKDGFIRLLDNPRITAALKALPYGTVYDRHQIPLASSKWDELMQYRKAYEDLGIKLEAVCREGRRCYPFGSKTFFLLGNAQTRSNWTGQYIAYIEKDYENRLRGFDRQTIDNIYLKHDYRALIPIVRAHYAGAALDASLLPHPPKDVHTTIDINLQLALTEIVEKELAARNLKKSGVIVLNPQTGELLASVSYPYPEDNAFIQTTSNDSINDRARQEPYPPGSTFKIVTEMAALSIDEQADQQRFECIQLKKNRVGSWVRGREVRDDDNVKKPHGNITFQEAFIKSCNAYFAHLGTDFVKAENLLKTAKLFDITIGDVAKQSDEEYKKEFLNSTLQDSSYGQAAITASPYQMAGVAATIANNGMLPYAHWINEEDLNDNDEQRRKPSVFIISSSNSDRIAEAMRGVVNNSHGTAYGSFKDFPVQVAGKTGTAEPNSKDDKRAHSWFIGFAPYDKQERIAFAVIVEHGEHGKGPAAAITKKLVLAARKYGYIK
jgi:cell division protein FtsI/penicillin-binding protein 2/cell division protein FtsW (lipid II flippase)